MHTKLLTLLALSLSVSCSPNKKVVTLAMLEGEWACKTVQMKEGHLSDDNISIKYSSGMSSSRSDEVIKVIYQKTADDTLLATYFDPILGKESIKIEGTFKVKNLSKMTSSNYSSRNLDEYLFISNDEFDHQIENEMLRYGVDKSLTSAVGTKHSLKCLRSQ